MSVEQILEMINIEQANTGICWFAALIHIFHLSDGFRNRRLVEISKTPLNDVIQYLNWLSGQQGIITLTAEVINYITSQPLIYAPLASSPNVFSNLLREYKGPNNNPYEFVPKGVWSGGYTIEYIAPYLYHIKRIEMRKIHQVVCEFPRVLNYFSDSAIDIKDMNPRRLKYLRVVADHFNLNRVNVSEIDIFTLTFIQDGMFLNIANIDQQFELYTGKYIAYISGMELHVFKLDSMTLVSFNNNVRGSGHVISGITIDDECYILNSYPDKGQTDGVNVVMDHVPFAVSSAVVKHNWKKYEDDLLLFSHKIEVLPDEIPKSKDGHLEPFNPFKDYQSEKDVYYYHRNIGNNTFIYKRDVSIDMTFFRGYLLEYQSLIPLTDNLRNIVYHNYIIPYFVLFNLINKTIYPNSVLIENTPDFIGFIKIQKGKLGGNLTYFTTTMNREPILDMFPDDFQVYYKNSGSNFEIIIGIELIFNPLDKIKHYGGKKRSRKFLRH